MINVPSRICGVCLWEAKEQDDEEEGEGEEKYTSS